MQSYCVSCRMNTENKSARFCVLFVEIKKVDL